MNWFCQKLKENGCVTILEQITFKWLKRFKTILFSVSNQRQLRSVGSDRAVVTEVNMQRDYPPRDTMLDKLNVFFRNCNKLWTGERKSDFRRMCPNHLQWYVRILHWEVEVPIQALSHSNNAKTKVWEIYCPDKSVLKVNSKHTIVLYAHPFITRLISRWVKGDTDNKQYELCSNISSGHDLTPWTNQSFKCIQGR